MTFLHLGLLGGAAFIAVPIILHLVMRKQPKHLEFPALRFIKQREHANRRRLRLRHLLLLLLRCAVLALLAFALARPSINSAGTLADQEAPAAVAMVIDSNPRMEYRHRNQTRIQAAQETALWLLPQLPRESDVAIVDSRPGAPGFSVDSGAARQRIRTLASTPVARPLVEVMQGALELLAKSDKPRKEIYVFSDLASPAWPPTAAAELQRRLKAIEGIGVYLIDVGVTDVQNFGLHEIKLSSQVLSNNTPLQIQTTLLHAGAEGERTAELYVLDPAGQATKRSQQIAKLRSGENLQLEFRLGGLGPGMHQGYVKIPGEDGLAADDVRYFTVSVNRPWRVLIATGGKPNEAGLFLREALAPAPLRAKGAAAFDCELVGIDKLNSLKLEQYQAICLLDPPALADAVWQRLSAFAAQGGGVAIFLGHNSRPIDAFNSPVVQELLPGKLVREWRAGQHDVYIASDRMQHPLLSKFRPLEGNVPWTSLPVFRHWELGPLAKGDDIVLAFTNGQPALVERPLEKGHVLVMTTPVSDPANRRDTWNLLPTGEEPWPFVMLANEMMLYLVGSRETRLNYTVGETAVLALQSNQHQPMFAVTTPRGDTVRQAADDARGNVAVTFTDSPGNYQVRAGGGQGAVSLGFSANLPGDVSQLDRASAEDLRQLFGDVKMRIARNREEIDRNVNMQRVGRELYPLLIILMVGFLAAEQLLSNYFYRVQPGGRTPERNTGEKSPVKQQPSEAVMAG